LLAAMATACASAPPPPPPGPEKTTVDVTVSGSQKEAFDQVRTAFVNEGLTIADANVEGGVIASAPMAANTTSAMYPMQITYRANILPPASGDIGSRVLLSAEAKIVGGAEASTGMFTVRSEGRSGAVRESCLTQQPNGPCAQAWERLNRIGAAVGIRR
jgi:hypothetical protein